MYNKLFTKILDSSIWLAPDPHRLVWITLISAMDENGYAAFACAENLANRARVAVDDTKAAIAAFERPLDRIRSLKVGASSGSTVAGLC